MKNKKSMKEIIEIIKNKDSKLEDIKSIVIKIKEKIHADYDIIFHESKNVNIYHNLLKEIGYIEGIVNFIIEGVFDNENMWEEIVVHLDNISQIYSEYDLEFKMDI
ncbi:MAG: hypothetical protein EU551_01415 [Promethearchaeota archaeon]|nr:MAG: hypothetical protein EU551_01415 [Candidatus Lokiarchaeota archaeon]